MSSESFSKLQLERLRYSPPLPATLASPNFTIKSTGVPALPSVDVEKLAALFPATFGQSVVSVVAGSASAASVKPLRVGCVLSGGQAAGGHNVISGLYDALKRIHKDSILYGFLDGPKGLMTGKYVVIDDAKMDRYRNMGGFDIIGSGRDKIETPEQFQDSKMVAERLSLDGIIVIGGDDSNTNAAMLAEYFKAQKVPTQVIGCPKTIDGDLKIPGQVDISFGFDTACATYSELIGNVCLDSLSSGKYYHFIRLMGRAASNITLECALSTQPNMALIGEEVAIRQQNLSSVTEELVNMIVERAAAGKHHGVILVPEGLIEFVPEVNTLLKEINDLLAHGTEALEAAVLADLTPPSAALFSYLPASIRKQLLADRDPHGNVQVSLIETEKLLAELVAHELDRLKRAGKYTGTFVAQNMFFGYEARCGLPSDFDTAYCYALGFNAALLISLGQTGLMSSVTNLGAPVEEWTCGGVPLVSFMNLERRHGKDKPVIKKWLVDLKGLPFRTFAAKRHEWAMADDYHSPGPIQLDCEEKKAARAPGATRVDPLCFTLALELQERKEASASSSNSSTAAAAPAELSPEAAKIGYTALCEGILSEGTSKVTTQDIHRLEVYRTSHGITDAVHFEVIAKHGLSKEKYGEVIAQVRAAFVSK